MSALLALDTSASFPAEVKAPAQYGTGIQTLATYLVEGQCGPLCSCQPIVTREVLGIQLSAGSIASFVTTCHQHLADVETRLKTALVQAKVIHQDETGLRVGKTGWWVHVCATDSAHPLRRSSQRRGRPALEAIGIAPRFRGTSVHDGWTLLSAATPSHKPWCNVHHLRELTFVEEALQAGVGHAT